jgi:hypothetical protein
MKIILSIFTIFTFTFATESTQNVILQKLIIGSSNTQSSLDAVKSYAKENETIQALQQKHQFTIEMECLGEYNVTVIKPIKSLSVRNTLFILLSPMFKDIFYVEDPLNIAIPDYSSVKKEDSLGWMYYGIGLQWIALFLLSFIGLILSIHSRKKISQLIESQNFLQEEQRKMDREIKALGGDNV